VGTGTARHEDCYDVTTLGMSQVYTFSCMCAREVITCTQSSKDSETVFCRNYHSLGSSSTCFEIYWVFTNWIEKSFWHVDFEHFYHVLWISCCASLCCQYTLFPFSHFLRIRSHRKCTPSKSHLCSWYSSLPGSLGPVGSVPLWTNVSKAELVQFNLRPCSYFIDSYFVE
jgi:hypothetical protein